MHVRTPPNISVVIISHAYRSCSPSCLRRPHTRGQAGTHTPARTRVGNINVISVVHYIESRDNGAANNGSRQPSTTPHHAAIALFTVTFCVTSGARHQPVSAVTGKALQHSVCDPRLGTPTSRKMCVWSALALGDGTVARVRLVGGTISTVWRILKVDNGRVNVGRRGERVWPA